MATGIFHGTLKAELACCEHAAGKHKVLEGASKDTEELLLCIRFEPVVLCDSFKEMCQGRLAPHIGFRSS